MDTFRANWPFMLVPIVVTIVGGLFSSSYQLSAKARSQIQHFTAGVVFAAIAGEVIPDVIHRDKPISTVAGFVLGVALMFGISRIAGDAEERVGAAGGFPIAMVVAVCIDGLIDGLVIGVGFTVGTTLGTLVTVALS